MIPKTANISVISEDPVFINRLKLFSSKSGIKFSYHPDPIDRPLVDLYIIDSSKIGMILEQNIFTSKTKIIAHGRPKDLKPAFDAGCKDYLRDPWDIDELEIRIFKILYPVTGPLNWSNLKLDQCTLESGNETVSLTTEENAIMRILILNKGEPVPREALLYTLWGKFKRDSRAVDMHISSLRSKIRTIVSWDDSAQCRIKTVRGCGYMLD